MVEREQRPRRRDRIESRLSMDGIRLLKLVEHDHPNQHPIAFDQREI
jgi:hypothetical protein